MKKLQTMMFILAGGIVLTACGTASQAAQSETGTASAVVVAGAGSGVTGAAADLAGPGAETQENGNRQEETEALPVETISGEQTEEGEDTMLQLQIGEHTLTAVLEDNSSAEALKELLKNGPVTVEMEDYANMEKVGSLGTSLPRNDVPTVTEAGDLILYQGNSFVIYYDTNSWTFTRLGKINGVSGEALKEILGSGDVSVTLSLTGDGAE